MNPNEVKTWLIMIVVIIGAIAIAYVVTNAVGIAIPAFIITILWIVLAVVIGVVAIKFIWSLIKS